MSWCSPALEKQAEQVNLHVQAVYVTCMHHRDLMLQPDLDT